MVALFIGATLLFSCTDEASRIDDISNKNEVPAQKIEGLKVTSSSGGKIRYIMNAPVIRSFMQLEEPYDEFPQGGHVEVYNDSMQLETTITAKFAIHHKKPEEEIWLATDSVVVHNFIKGQSLYTDTLYWDMTKHEIYTNSYVKIVTPNMTIPSEHGMKSDDRLRNYELRTIRDSEVFYDEKKFNDKTTNPS